MLSSIISLWFYLATFALCAAMIGYGEKYQKRWLRVLGLAIPILVAGFRYNVGIDYGNYTRIGADLATFDYQTYSTRFATTYEPTFYLFAKISNFFGPNFVVFFLLYAIITIVPAYLAIRKVSPKYSWLAMLLYLLLFYATTLNVMRQLAAAAICFFAATCYIYDKRDRWRKVARFALLILLAYLVHTSALLMIIFLPLHYFCKYLAKRDTQRIIIYHILFSIAVIAILVVLILNIGDIPLINKYAMYLERDTGSGMPVPNPIPKLLPLLVGILALPKLLKRDKNNVFFFTMICMAIITTVPGYFIMFGYRMADYFAPFHIRMFTSIIQNMTPTKRCHTYITALICYGVLYFIYSAMLSNSQGIFPYKLMALF